MYNTGFTAEANNAYGEALQSRVYIRKVAPGYGIANYWDSASGREYLYFTSNTLSYSSMTSPTFQTPRYMEDVDWAFLNYFLEEGEFAEYDDINFSAYIHTGSSWGNSGAAGLKIYTELSGSTEDNMGVNLTASTDGVMSIYASGGTNIVASSIEDVGDGWYRVSLSTTQPATDRGIRSYYFRVSTALDNGNNPELWFVSPQIDVQTLSARTFHYAEGVVFHPGDLIEIADYNRVLNTNQFVRKRERSYGVVQATNQQLSISNVDLTYVDRSLPDSWCAVQVGFPSYDVWETVYQGRINGAKTNTELTCTLDIDDSIMELLDNGISREMFLGNSVWISEVTVDDKDADSDSYTGTITSPTSLSGFVVDQRYTITFENTTEFRVFDEAGNPLNNNVISVEETGTTFSISADASFSPQSYLGRLSNVYTIPSDGWDGTTYASGDSFKFTASAPRTTGQTTAIGMVKHLIEDVALVKVYDVMNDDYYDSPLYDLENWDNIMSGTGGFPALEGQIGGHWTQGTKIIEMIQDALKLEHCSIYPVETGQIALAYMANNESGSESINGDPTLGTVDLISGDVEDSSEDFANVITVEYLDFDTGEDKSVTNEDQYKVTAPTEKTIKTKWRVEDGLANTCGSRALYRFNNIKRVFNLNTTLAKSNVELTYPITIVEPFLNAYSEKVTVVERAIDVNNQAIRLVAWNDPLSTLNVARIGITVIDQTDELIW